MKEKFVEPEIDVILLDDEIRSTLPIGGSGDSTDSGDDTGGGL